MDLNKEFAPFADLPVSVKEEHPFIVAHFWFASRNLDQIPFPSVYHRDNVIVRWPDIAAMVEAMVVKVLDSLTKSQAQTLGLGQKKTFIFDSDFEKRAMQLYYFVEKHLLFPHAGLYTSLHYFMKSQTMLWINAREHLNLVYCGSGLITEKQWLPQKEILKFLDQKLVFASHRQTGYIATHVQNCGLGERFAYLLFIPGIVLTDQLDHVVRASKYLDIHCRGFASNEKWLAGPIWEMQTKETGAHDPAELLMRFNRFVEHIEQIEYAARQKLIQSESTVLLDKMRRSLAALQNALLMSTNEALEHLTYLAMALEKGLVDGLSRKILYRTWIRMQKTHLQVEQKKDGQNMENEYNDMQWDWHRALLLRQSFADVCLRGANA